LEELLQDVGRRVKQWVRLSENTFEFACAARARFAKGDAKTKKEILSTIGSNLTLKDKNLCIEATKPFFILEKSLCVDETEDETIEPKTAVMPQGQEEANASFRPSVLWDLYEVRTFPRDPKEVVTSVYNYFRSLCGSIDFKLSDWKSPIHENGTAKESVRRRRLAAAPIMSPEQRFLKRR